MTVKAATSSVVSEVETEDLRAVKEKDGQSETGNMQLCSKLVHEHQLTPVCFLEIARETIIIDRRVIRRRRSGCEDQISRNEVTVEWADVLEVMKAMGCMAVVVTAMLMIPTVLSALMEVAAQRPVHANIIRRQFPTE
jgi:hypothetical protein